MIKVISSSSNDFPLVSGSIFSKTKNPADAMAPKMKKVMELPKFDNSQGNTSCKAELINELTKAIIPIAIPLYFIGYNSESKTHMTGPSEKAKQAMNPKIPVRTKLAFILVAASSKMPSFFL